MRNVSVIPVLINDRQTRPTYVIGHDKDNVGVPVAGRTAAEPQHGDHCSCHQHSLHAAWSLLTPGYKQHRVDISAVSIIGNPRVDIIYNTGTSTRLVQTRLGEDYGANWW